MDWNHGHLITVAAPRIGFSAFSTTGTAMDSTCRSLLMVEKLQSLPSRTTESTAPPWNLRTFMSSLPARRFWLQYGWIPMTWLS